MLEKKHTKYICIKAVNVQWQMLCLNFFSTTLRNRSLQTETWVLKVHLSEELWAVDLSNTETTRLLFLQLYQNFTATMSMNTWKNDFKQDLEKSGWPQGQGSTPACWGLQSVVRSWRECVCVRTYVCVYIQISIYINNHG